MRAVSSVLSLKKLHQNKAKVAEDAAVNIRKNILNKIPIPFHARAFPASFQRTCRSASKLQIFSNSEENVRSLNCDLNGLERGKGREKEI